MLARYFDVATAIVGRYGGTLEKFIGDAVVAVWGTPVALEDDAERAVRAALDLVAAVADLGDEHSGSLELRAAVSTGETAVTIGALGQGMVAGDVVNTTARMQSAANSGSVLIDEATRRATEAAIQSAPAGAFTLKGKTEPVELWAALRVVAARGGEGRSRGLEPPFVGRDREFQAGEGGRAGDRRRRPRPTGVDRRRRGHRQEPARLGVREAHRRVGRRLLVASGAMSELWRRRRVLGAGRDAARARADQGGRFAGDDSCEARRNSRAVRPRRRGGRLDHTLASAPARTRGAERRRPRAAVLRLAAVLRANGIGCAHRARFRGHPVGRPGPARLHRVPDGVVARPSAAGRHARAPRAVRSTPRVGSGVTRVHVACARSVLTRDDA